MFTSNRSANSSSYSKRVRNYENEKTEFSKDEELKSNNQIKKLNETPKVEFRKVLKPRIKSSRVEQLDDLQQKSVLSNRSSRYFEKFNNEVETGQKNLQQSKPNKRLSFKNLSLNKQRSQQQIDLRYEQKSLLDSRVKIADKKKDSKDSSAKKLIRKSQNKLSDSNLRPKSSLPKRDLLDSARSNRSLIKVKQQKKSDQKQLNQNDEKQILNKQKFRPKSSISDFSPIQHLKNKQRNTNQFSNFEKSQQKTYFVKNQQTKAQQFDNLIEQFLSLQSKINKLIADKWKIIQEKLLKEKQQSRVNKSNSRLNTKEKVSISFQRISQKNQISLKKNHKFSFSKVLAQKNIDNEIMTHIKLLRNLNFSQFQSDKEVDKDLTKILQEMQKRRAQIIQQALAQSMVESQLLKKYYSGQNAQSLSTSNHKVGQVDLKNKIMSANIKKIETQQRNIINRFHQKLFQQRETISKQSQSKRNYIPPNSQDYEKYRYKHPQFNANLQPLPRSSYKSQFFNYSNVQIFNSRYKPENNMIFPTTSTLKSSSYRNQYIEFSPERINYKQLDAYKNKFKQIDVVYMPKKRSQSQAYTTRKGSKANKYLNQLDYVKRLKTQSMLGNSLDKQITHKLASKFFATETKNEYQNPQNSSQHFEKSQIKHKKLHMLKYDMKKKYRV